MTLGSWLLGDRSLPKGHRDDGCHVSLITKHKDWDAQSLSHFPHHSAREAKLEFMLSGHNVNKYFIERFMNYISLQSLIRAYHCWKHNENDIKCGVL